MAEKKIQLVELGKLAELGNEEVNKILVDLEDVYDDVGSGLKYILTYGSDDPDELLDQFEGEFKHGLQRIKELRKTFTDEQGDS
tara:strand:+ start:2258 stop:2509 length:252 start_codon:yes stop_codon:yes gene_type:complete